MKASLWVFGVLQSVSTLTFFALAKLGYHYPMMVAAIGIENLCSGMGRRRTRRFLMSLCDRRFTATQYALLTSLMAVTARGRRRPHGRPRGHLRVAGLLQSSPRSRRSRGCCSCCGTTGGRRRSPPAGRSRNRQNSSPTPTVPT